MSGQDKESKQAQTDRQGTTSKRNFFQPLLLDEDHGICYRWSWSLSWPFTRKEKLCFSGCC